MSTLLDSTTVEKWRAESLVTGTPRFRCAANSSGVVASRAPISIAWANESFVPSESSVRDFIALSQACGS